MARRSSNPLRPLAETDSLREAAQALVKQVQDEAAKRALSPAGYERAIKELERVRGRPLVNPSLSSGAGQGARVRLADGSTKLDFIGGIGVYGFGHADPDLLETAVLAAASDVCFQGHLVPGPEYLRLSKALLRHSGPRLKHVWLSLSGAVANENALKIIFQKHAPADHIIVFEGGFHGRTAAMAELTDRPAFREGQPLHGNVLHVPFYDADDPDSTAKSLAALDAHLKRRPGRIGGMCFELIQGEGGFKMAPREFFVELMTRCREAEIAVWVDEVQTFARTGELFCTKSLELDEFVDVITAGKTLQGSAMLFSKAYNPKPGLVAGTYAGSTVGMAVGARIIERLEDEGYLGPEGRVRILGQRIEKRFESLKKKLPKAVGPRSGVGAMQAFVPFDGSPDVVRAVLKEAYDQGVIMLSTGSLPMKIRMLPPVNTTDEELESAFSVLERALSVVGEARGLPVLILRPIETGDLQDLYVLADQLDSMNLPADLDFLTGRIEKSLRSFAGELSAGEPGTYVFVLEDRETSRCIGSSMILAKHGVPGSAYYWFEVSTEERRSNELGKRFVHKKLRLRSTEDGPTEIGGLILDPAYRRHPEKCGKALSIVRFAFIGAHPDLFEREVIAEMLSPFEASGENLLWEAFGSHFTGMSYREADHLSARNKQFIADLFPRDPVYATLFPKNVQEVIGKPNDTAVAAVRILEKVGFRNLNQVDPFDGGPYYGAARDAIASVRERRELVLASQPRDPNEATGGPLALLSAETSKGFRAAVTKLDVEGAPVVCKRYREELGVAAGDRVTVTPLPEVLHVNELVSVSPAEPEDEIGRYPVAGDGAVADAVARARAAFPAWRNGGFEMRANALTRFRDIVKGRVDELAELIAREMGKASWDAKGEAALVPAKVDVTLAEGMAEVQERQAAPGARATFHPRGVMSVLGPFNFPAHLPNGHIVPALATGNTVVFKPSELTPGVGEWMAQAWREAELPRGVFEIVQGAASTGAALALHPEVDGILFTGSYEAGRALSEATLDDPGKILALEMGGKNAIIVMDDADLDLAISEAALSICATTGQRCSCASRLFVHTSVIEEFSERLRVVLENVAVGYPLTEGVFMGPLVSKRAYDKVTHYRSLSASEVSAGGAGGERLLLAEPGLDPPFVGPGLVRFDSTVQSHPYQRNEIFGPEAAIYPITDLDQAIAAVNDSDYGLVAAVITKDRARYEHCVGRIRTGLLNWNKGTIGASGKLPFGGIKKSGNDRPAGISASLYCTIPQAHLESEAPFDPTTLPPGMPIP